MSSQTQNVQRGLIFLFFLHVLVLLFLIIFKFCKNTLDPVSQDEAAQGQNEGKYKQSDAKNQADKESMDKIDSDPNFDKVAVKTETSPDENASYIQRFFHSSIEYRNFYTPVLMLAIMNIDTGTSKAFSIILYFATVFWIVLFNVNKIHRKCCGDSKCVNVLVQNLWLVFSFFFFINHWAAFTIMMPYVVV